MVADVHINNKLLISLIEARPVVWDKTLDLYKNRQATHAAWKVITEAINRDLESKDAKTKHVEVKQVIQRWAHIRDHYIRSLKRIQDHKKSSNEEKPPKPYVYGKQLSFLLKVLQFDETDDSNAAIKSESEETDRNTRVADQCYIDNELLISLVKQIPYLWDNTEELYKHRAATLAAWKDIMLTLNPECEEKDEETKQAYVKHIIQRWTNIRDNYNRSRKKIQDQKRLGSAVKTKPYVYSRHLSFLDKFLTRSNRTIYNEEDESEEDNIDTDDSTEANTIDVSNIPKTKVPIFVRDTHKRPMKSDTNPVEVKMIKKESCSQEPTINRHRSFFNSVLPTLEQFNDDEVLEFQMGVLQLLKNIKNNGCNP